MKILSSIASSRHPRKEVEVFNRMQCDAGETTEEYPVCAFLVGTFKDQLNVESDSTLEKKIQDINNTFQKQIQVFLDNEVVDYA